jgi:hypothetical protein
MNSRLFKLGLAATFAMISAVGVAQAATKRVRGTIEKFDGGVLTVKSKDGTATDVKIPDAYKVAAVKKMDLSSIKSGDYVGAAAMPQSDGTLKALEVTIFPAAQRGLGEGFRPFDMQPNSTMTNATVSSAVESVDGRTLTLTYKGGEKKVVVPKNAPVVTYVPATHADVKPGVFVSINATKADDGSLSADHFNIGKDGVVPPT